MAQITAALVKELRDKTSAGMMDCKKALKETDGDLEAAIDWLRTKGIAKADKKAGRVAAEGLVAFALADNKGSLVEVNSETDFVARNEGFQGAVSEIATLALGCASTEELASTKTSTGEKVTDFLTTLVAKIGENMGLRRMNRLVVEKGTVTGYMHNAVTGSMGKIGVLVALESDGDKAALDALGKKIAIHVAATNPLALSVADIDQAVVSKEREMLKAEALESGKPEAIVDKMVEGRMTKFFEQVLADEAKSIGSDIKMTGYVRMELGEGIEKKEEDFAAEVAKTAAGG